MADNIYENQFCFVDSSTIIAIIFSIMISLQDIICRQLEPQKLTLIHQLGSILYHPGSWSCFSQIRPEILHTANDTAITSAMWNIASACTKQNYIV